MAPTKRAGKRFIPFFLSLGQLRQLLGSFSAALEEENFAQTLERKWKRDLFFSFLLTSLGLASRFLAIAYVAKKWALPV